MLTGLTDTKTAGLGMAFSAWLLGLAIITRGYYSLPALCTLTAALVVCIAAVGLRRVTVIESWSSREITAILAGGVFVEACILLVEHWVYPSVEAMFALLALLALAQAFDLGRARVAAIVIMMVVFVAAGAMAVRFVDPNPPMDVLIFQQGGADALLHGQNPYAVRFHNQFAPDTPIYGRGVVDANNDLTIGYPYPPLSLLMVMPSFLLVHDVRLADAAAIAFAAGLMAAARGGRRAALAATLFLLTPRMFRLIELSWTEALLALTFSMVMYCAIRWRAALPYALGLFLATKQYSIFAIPLVWLLTTDENAWKEFVALVVKSTLLAAVITAPFIAWNVPAFWRSVVLFQMMQPFRLDSLSYLVWMHEHMAWLGTPVWLPFVLVVAAIAWALRRFQRSASAFASAAMLVYFVFFAFNKQAFYNYYFFVAATGFWTLAATRWEEDQVAAVRQIEIVRTLLAN